MQGLNKDERKIIYGKLGYAEWVVARVAHNLPVDIDAKFANECAEKGYLELLERFDPPIDDGIFWAICMENKNYRLLEWAGDRARPTDDTMPYLAGKGNVDLMQSCIDFFGIRCSVDDSCREAARNGQLRVFEWMLEIGIVLDIPKILLFASDDIVKWVNGLFLPFGTRFYRI